MTGLEHTTSDPSSSDTEELVGSPIDGHLVDEDKSCFELATSQLLLDDSRSVRCRFWLKLSQQSSSNASETTEDSETDLRSRSPDLVEIDANGILIHDRFVGVPTHVNKPDSVSP